MKYAEITLSQGKIAKVDLIDLPLLGDNKWYVLKTRDKFYAKQDRYVDWKANKKKTVLMHRLVWRCYLQYNGKPKRWGSFGSPIEAAVSYNEEAKRLFGEFAVLNVI